MTHSLSKPTGARDLTHSEIMVIEAGRRTDEEQRRIAALTKLAEIEDRALVYEAYINSPEWRAKAERIKERDGRRCRVCNGRSRLSVHHRTYEDLGHEQDSDLLTLCQDCHQVFHDNRRLR